VLEKEKKRRRTDGETNETSEDSETEGHQRKKSRRDKVLENFIWLTRSYFSGWAWNSGLILHL
jgi:hypothetical protein